MRTREIVHALDTVYLYLVQIHAVLLDISNKMISLDITNLSDRIAAYHNGGRQREEIIDCIYFSIVEYIYIVGLYTI